MLAVNTALEDIGEHLSPKYARAMIAPAAMLIFTLPLFAKIIITIPIVPTVPKAVPSKKDTILHNIKA